jgi:hypothetical protein
MGLPIYQYLEAVSKEDVFDWIKYLTGMPLMRIKYSSLIKLKNLQKHENIIGLSVGRGKLWKIEGQGQEKSVILS